MSTNELLPVEIGTRRYVIDGKGLVRRPLTSTRQMQDFSREPSDATLDNQGIWKRTQSDFILGAGQQYLDQEDESERRRFRASKGIDVWGRRQLTLLPDTSSPTSVSTGTTGASLTTGSGVYFVSGTGGSYFNGSTWTACTGMAGTLGSLTAIGGHVYAAGTSTLRRASLGGTAFSTFGALTPTIVGTGGGRLIGAQGGLIYEILNDGTKRDIYTHFDAAGGFNWKKIVSAPNGIYCFGDDGVRSVVWLLTVADATGELTAPYPTLQMPDGEFIRDSLFFGGVMVLATNLGFRLATINGSGFLTAGPRVDIGNVECLATDGRDIWFGWTNFDGTSTGLGRMRPERFTDTLVPAYASDLMYTGQGNVRTVASFNGKRYFLAAVSSVGRVVAEATTRVATGSLWTGAVTYGTPEKKAVNSIEAAWDALPAGSSVTVQVLDGLAGAAQPGGIANTTTGSNLEKGDLAVAFEGEEIEVKVTLTRGTTTTTAPVVRRWTLRSMVLPYRTSEVILPVILAQDVIHYVDGRPVEVAFDVLEEFEYLNGLMEGRSLIDVTIGDRTEKMMLDALGIAPDVEGVGFKDWTKTQDWFNAVWSVRLLTVEPTT